MCAKLPDNVSTVSIPVAIPDLAPVVTAVRAPAPAPVAAPPEPAPAHPPLTVETYRLKKMFPMENDKYIVSVLRENKAEASAIDVTMTLSARVKRETVEYVESGPGQTLEAGATSYFGLRVSTVVFDEILDAPEEAGTEIEWSVSYRFQDDAPDERRCFRLQALPRRREPEGISWLNLGKSHECATPTR